MKAVGALLSLANLLAQGAARYILTARLRFHRAMGRLSIPPHILTSWTPSPGLILSDIGLRLVLFKYIHSTSRYPAFCEEARLSK